jgi:predicted SAM-dependent methyltransferase
MVEDSTPSNRLVSAAKKFCDVTGIPRYFVRQFLFELRMTVIRLNRATPIARLRLRRLQNRANLRLMFGCGAIRRQGWVGIDCFSGEAVDLLLDLRRLLPFTDSCADYCYSEHFLEHLYPEEAMLHLKEVCRILKPGGVYRVVVPAGIRFAERYLAGDKEFFRLAHPWEARPLDAVYKIVNWGGAHRGLYDFEQLRHLAMKVGFSDARECQANQSPIPELRIDRSEPQRVAESLYAELIKA